MVKFGQKKEQGNQFYGCATCFAFRGSHGKAYLFTHADIAVLGKFEERALLTGVHVVCDVYCRGCHKVIGWKYFVLIMSSEQLIAVHPYISPKDHESLASVLILIGFVMMMYFFIYFITYKKKEQRNLTKEIILGVGSSIFLAGGTLFFFLAAGIYL